jgi:mevalonate kinase
MDGTIRRVNLEPGKLRGDYRFFLLNSGERFETGPLVNHFLERMKDPGFASSIRNEYNVINQKLIESLLGEREADPAMLVRILSDFQYTHFRKMIPEKMLDIWIEGLVTNQYYLKLNGSGGGYILGIAHDTAMESLEEKWKESIIWIK